MFQLVSQGKESDPSNSAAHSVQRRPAAIRYCLEHSLLMIINKEDFARILVGYLSRRSCKKTWQAVKGTESNERAHVYTLKLMDGRMDKRVAYNGRESSLLLLNYCKEGIKYEEQKNLAMDVHYKEPIPDAKSHMFAHPFFSY
ncbi:hypothetical protein H0E87_029679 [Populus deltoides]|uniref:Uncharacterized protein n=1 Tax=Populus deltoides TaxID=3696 RepID=A0A8T2WLY5_POPDE|nr:hypothetical protein H0E87_029679 [Populus deltoides]